MRTSRPSCTNWMRWVCSASRWRNPRTCVRQRPSRQRASKTVVAAAVTRLHPEQQLIADGYVRVSRVLQAEGHSPDIQREAIKRLIAQHGYFPGVIEEDHERGSKIDRKGYLKIIERV